ncbi:MAG: oxygen-insensitive NADPH nitroreductase [Gammaproteobacteria bacterium]|nr:oxygen-insensitive NADPH nitroreductase [Gammaproteobacteria bacterium]
MNEVIQLLQSHRSVRKFTEKEIPQDTLNELVKCGQSAATSSFIQACTVIQVEDKTKRDELVVLAGNQKYIATASRFLVFCADMNRHQLACDMHQAEMQSGFTEQFITATVDCALFAQNVITAAQSLGIQGVYIGGIRNQIQAVTDLLELPKLVYPVFGMCLGYPAQNPEVKPRLPLSVVLKKDSYNDESDQATIEEYDNHVREYYRTRTGGNKDTAWSEQISEMLVKEARPHMLAYLKSQGYLIH